MSWYEQAAKAISEALGCETVEGYDEKAEAIAAIIAKHDPNRWVPVTEQLPPLHEAVLLCLPVSGVRIGYRGERKNGSPHWMAYDPGEHVDDPTHWRKIVAPEVGT